MSFKLGSPPDPKDARFFQWINLLWKYVTSGIADNSDVVEAGQIFNKHNQNTFMPGIQSSDAQTVGMTRAFRQMSPMQVTNYADSQSILATQIFGG